MTMHKTHTEIGFIGLGIMGKPMVLNLINAGFKIHFYARKRTIIKDVKKHGGIFHNKINLIVNLFLSTTISLINPKLVNCFKVL